MEGTSVFLALMLGVAVNYPQSVEAIYNGNTTTMNTHRYLVSILKNGTFRCAGVIVSTSWIVTLADCTDSLNASDITVVDSSSDGLTGKSHSVKQIVTHPDYGTQTLDYDFSCVQISGTFYYGKRRAHKLPTAELDDNSTVSVTGYGCTICGTFYYGKRSAHKLPTAELEENSTVTVSGYGCKTSGCAERALRKASMVWLPKASCNSTYSKYGLQWTRLGCIDNPDGATLCKGDFGDPLVSGQTFYGMFASAVSKGFCTSSASPAIVTDVYPVADWVRDITGAT